MASVAKLKDKARDFERKEDWAKAVEAYLQVIQATEKDHSEAELSLYNRVGDLYLRLGKPSNAVDYYSKAADHYGEAGLYNNAIALCNKALRYQPDRLELYRKLGKLSAEQGFVTDARRWYLEYAEKLAKQGRKDAAFDALKEFASLAEDPEIREMLAAQLGQRGEPGEAVVQLRLAWTQYTAQGNRAQAESVRKRILSLDPTLDATDLTLTADGAAAAGKGADLPGMYIDSVAAGTPAPAATETIGVDEGYGFGEIAEPVDEPAAAEPLPGLDEAPTAADVETTTLPGLESTDFGSMAQEVTAADLPTLELENTSLIDEESTEVFELPTLDAADEATEATDEAGAFDLPMLDTGDSGLGELPTFDLGGDALATLDDVEEAEALPSLDEASFDATGTESDALPSLEPLSLDTVDADEPGTRSATDVDEWGDAPGSGGDIAELTETGAGLLEEEESAEEIELEREPEPAAAGARADTVDVYELIASARARFEAGEREALASLEAQHVNLADVGRLADAYRVAEALVALDPNAITSHQARVEYAFRLDDRTRLVAAYLDFAACLRRTGAGAKAESVYGRVLEIDPQNAAARAALAKPEPAKKPIAPSDDFVDLGGLLMEDEEETTRFVVAETVESGDEERDFAEMLSTFRAKIAQHVPQEDTESHYDLGIAFKEMGLIDEAISEFQVALRGGNERLKVYEELGSCFMQKQQYAIAAQLLARGAQLPARDDAELLGVYYLLGRAYEEMGQTQDAKEAYERVLGLDIDFRDVNDRLARL